MKSILRKQCRNFVGSENFSQQAKQGKVNFAFLNFKGHPRGNVIADGLVNAGHVPRLIIEEDSALATSGSSILSSDLATLNPAKYAPAPSVEDILQKENIKYSTVKNHNDEECIQALKDADIDLVVLGDCRILKDNLLSVPRKGVINTHPGYLPEVRGNHCSLYAIIHDLPLGCSVHFVNQGVDTGDIIKTQRIKLHKKPTLYPELLYMLNHVCKDLAIGAMDQMVKRGKIESQPQKLRNIHPFGTFTSIPKKIKEQAIVKLESGSYLDGSLKPLHDRHLEDES
mmetsp:Transcript_977/g.1403  ORF Transcript_977/g.1403 Transcript_977/m.1403 type:complete len:284 (+) Transcript_977:253-1104(+)|eukprot:CAMPEP_0204823702 /NCGR_PEP_ID=MMETSP1346-20131115/1787_1 /ASSEMBLY_ACC=CAM_ASM_000771 /TAXON_ID=215587 /ORGANISM="Aplanochytrium stocchinoi, Strain GSBS06" /LENGTH=283 /DNA_ID=CAMNT_0051950469 /DNA_START=245 /DNA_END=1096 /DNA_ORIENTATION=-